MKTHTHALTALMLLLGTPTVFAASTVDLTVKGLITPSACTPTLSANVVDLGKVSAKDLEQDTMTRLPAATLQLGVSCDGHTLFALQGMDNRSTSPIFRPGYGLGFVENTTVKIGAYNFRFANTGVADSAPAFPMESPNNGGKWWFLDDETYWSNTNIAAFGDGTGGSARQPMLIKDLTIDLFVDAYIAAARTLPLTSEIALDGSATLQLIYL